MRKRPNILFIGSDQHRFDALGINGNNILKTPNLDLLGADGINYTNAFTTCPVCTPARASLLTGQWSFQNQCLTIPNWTEIPRSFNKSLITFPQILKESGYNLGYVGKWHLGEEAGDISPSPHDIGFDKYISEREYPKWCKENNVYGSYQDGPAVSMDDDENVDPGRVWSARSDKISYKDSLLHWSSNKVIEMLSDFTSEDTPFFARWDCSAPHLPNIVPVEYAKLYNPESIPEWGSFKDDYINKPYIQKQQLLSWRVENKDWKYWSETIALYYGEITLMDYEIGRIINYLKENNLYNNTVIVYTTDHGDMCGSHKMIDKHFVMYDDVVKVPLIIKPVDSKIKGGVCDSFISHTIDLASTICELAGEKIPESFKGISLMNSFIGEKCNSRSFVISAYHGGQFGLYSQRMIRNNNFKYIWNCTDKDELYDLKNDPWELTNLVYSEDYSGILNNLRHLIFHELNASGDPLCSHPWSRVQLLQGNIS